jgi:hypothetical protein
MALAAKCASRLMLVAVIIEDDQGREKILIGSTIPAARSRVRTDLGRAKGVWAKRFPSAEKYIERYKSYQSDMNGILILDANGFDRVGIRRSGACSQYRKRIAPSNGLVINDEEGLESSEYGLLKFENRYRQRAGRRGRYPVPNRWWSSRAGVQAGSRHRSLGLHP